MYVDCLEKAKVVFGSKHPDAPLACGVNNLKDIYYSQGKYEAAEKLNSSCTGDTEELSLGSDNPSWHSSC
jgi:hypothetical protein